MWIATHDGLNVYDGYSFTVYRNDPSDPHSVADNSIRNLFVDSEATLWIAAGDKISRLRDDGRFDSYDGPSSRNILAMAELSPDRLLLSTSRGLHSFLKWQGSYDDSIIPEQMRKVSVRAFYSTGDDLLMGSSSGELFLWDLRNGDIRKIRLNDNRSSIRAICVDGNTVWVGTNGGGLYSVDKTTSEYRHYTCGTVDGLLSDYIRALCFDTEGRLWIGTFDGLVIYDGSSFTPCTAESPGDGGLSNNSIRSLFRDNQGGMWVGTYYGALNYWHPSRGEFILYDPSSPSSGSAEKIVGCIAPKEGSSVWLGVGHRGVTAFNIDKGKADFFDLHGDPAKANDVKAIFSDKERGKLYVGAMLGGLTVMDTKTGKTTPRPNIPGSVFSLVPKGRDSLFVCTEEALYTLDLKTGSVCETLHQPGMGGFRNLLRDAAGRFWFGGIYGVTVYRDDSLSEVIPAPELDDIRGVNMMLESSSGTVFIGTYYGLYSFNPEDRSLIRFTTEDGLPNNVVCSISEDSFGLIWIGTENGLCRYNPFNGVFRTYDRKDGIPCPRFSSRTACLLPDGRLLLGTAEGLLSFVPESIRDNPFCPPPVILGAEKGDGSSLKVTYATMNYLSAGRDRFRYRLKGYEKEWHQVIGENTAFYRSVPAGRYVFQLQCANNDGIWNSKIAERRLRVNPSWLRSRRAGFVAGAVAALLMAMAAFLIYRRRRAGKEVSAGGEDAPVQETPEEEFLRRAGEIVDRNMSNENFSTLELAREMGMSRSNMYNRMIAVTGSSALEFIKDRRFKEACRLLKTGRYGVSQVSDMVGFSSPSYFSRAFKNHIGLLPTEYLKKNRILAD